MSKRVVVTAAFIGAIAMTILVLMALIHHVREPFKVIDQLPMDKDQLVIVSSHYKEDIQWLKATDVPVVVCSKIDESALCRETRNKGREATAYLKFIVQNYDNLPNNVAFIHGHNDAWHQNMKGSLINVISNCAKYKQYGFISVNNNFIDDRNVTDNAIMQRLHRDWDVTFRPYLKRDPPEYVYHDCCAQFVVSRERILRHPKDAYETWYNYIMNDPNDVSGYDLSVMFEYIWHIIFGEPDVITPVEHRRMFESRCLE